MTQRIPHKRISERTLAQFFEVAVPQIFVEIVEVISERITDQIIDVPVPQILEEIVERMRSVPQDSISERICEQIINASVWASPFPTIQVETFQVFGLVAAQMFSCLLVSVACFAIFPGFLDFPEKSSSICKNVLCGRGLLPESLRLLKAELALHFPP